MLSIYRINGAGHLCCLWLQFDDVHIGTCFHALVVLFVFFRPMFGTAIISEKHPVVNKKKNLEWQFRDYSLATFDD